jgi:hypothetical protein
MRELAIILQHRGEVRVHYVDLGGGEVACWAPNGEDLSATDAATVERFCRIDLDQRRQRWLARGKLVTDRVGRLGIANAR